MVNSYLISPQLSTMIKDQEKLGSGTMWAHLSKVYSDYQLGKIQVCVYVYVCQRF